MRLQKSKTQTLGWLNVTVDTYDVLDDKANDKKLGSVVCIWSNTIGAYYYGYDLKGNRLMTNDDRPAHYESQVKAMLEVANNYKHPQYSFM